MGLQFSLETQRYMGQMLLLMQHHFIQILFQKMILLSQIHSEYSKVVLLREIPILCLLEAQIPLLLLKMVLYPNQIYRLLVLHHIQAHQANLLNLLHLAQWMEQVLKTLQIRLVLNRLSQTQLQLSLLLLIHQILQLQHLLLTLYGKLFQEMELL